MLARSLVVCAHPDDETLFFGGLLASHPDVEWHLVCATRATTRAEQRCQELERASRELGFAHIYMWDFVDDPQLRLPIPQLEERLRGLGEFDEVYTHGPLGEYGHPHHRDVSLAVHRVFEGVWSVATSVFPQRRVLLSEEAFRRKSLVLRQIYAQEVVRFLLTLPISSVEGFVQLSLQEVESLHGGRRQDVVIYADLLELIEQGAIDHSAATFISGYLAAQSKSPLAEEDN